MQDKIAQEVQEALTTSPEKIHFEQIQDEDSSPLNQPVVEKDIGGERPMDNEEKQKNWNVWKPNMGAKSVEEIQAQNQSTSTDFRSQVESSVKQERAQEPLDAPEQEINGNAIHDDTDNTIADSTFEVPLAQANQTADALLGMTNNVLAIGGGYFVKIGKHKEFYEFDEIIQVIDEQNEKNIQRIKLDKEDQALLRPLLAQVLRKKAKKLTPEQQLMGAVVSILMKKAQIIMEVRAENNLLEERILDIIREEKGGIVHSEEQEEADEGMETTSALNTQQIEKEKKPPETSEHFVQDIEAEEINDGISVLEVAEELKTDS